MHNLQRKVIEDAVTFDPTADDTGELSSRDDYSDLTLRSIPPPPARGIDDHMVEQRGDSLRRVLGDEGILIVKHGKQECNIYR